MPAVIIKCIVCGAEYEGGKWIHPTCGLCGGSGLGYRRCERGSVRTLKTCHACRGTGRRPIPAGAEVNYIRCPEHANKVGAEVEQ